MGRWGRAARSRSKGLRSLKNTHIWASTPALCVIKHNEGTVLELLSKMKIIPPTASRTPSEGLNRLILHVCTPTCVRFFLNYSILILPKMYFQSCAVLLYQKIFPVPNHNMENTNSTSIVSLEDFQELCFYRYSIEICFVYVSNFNTENVDAESRI